MISAGGRSLGREATKGEACLVAARWALVIVVTVRRDKLVREVKPGDRAQPRGTRRMPDGGARATRDRSMLTWHTAGGTGSEPSILLLRKPLLGVADRTRRCLPGVAPHSLSLHDGTASSNPASSAASRANFSRWRL